MNFEEILSMPMHDIEAPKPLPVGTYLAQIEPQYEIKKMGKNNTDVIEYNVRIISAYNDVDLDSHPEGVAGIKRHFRLWVMDTPESKYRLKVFFTETLGLEGTNLKALIPEAVGHTLAITIKQRPSEDGTRLYDEIAATAKA